MQKEYQEVYPLLLAGMPLACRLRFPDTAGYLKKYHDPRRANGKEAVQVADSSFRDWAGAGSPEDAFAEFCLLCQPVSELLLGHDRCLFHAAALRYRDRAVLISGGSGAGKSTHCRHLLERYPKEFSVINGDKPILERRGSRIIVHPSPWNGKEGLHGAGAATLAAIYILRRGDSDSVVRCSEKEAAIFSFPMIFQSFETEDVIRNAGEMTENIVRRSSCFIFNTKDVEESSSLLYNSIRDTANHEI